MLTRERSPKKWIRTRHGVRPLVLAGSALLAAFIAESALGLQSVTQSPPEPAASMASGGYVFDQITVEAQMDPITGEEIEGRARIEFGLLWEGSFPGARVCMWRVFDPSGRTIGTASFPIASMDPDVGRVHTDVDVSGDAYSANVICTGPRIDNVSGQLAIRSISLESPSAVVNHSFDVIVDYEWIGGGYPTPQSCTVEVLDQRGVTLLTRPLGLHSLDEAEDGLRVPFRAAESVAKGADSAEMTCEPIR